ncbi:MAG TPA: glycosyltransferase [Bryobacteraceae bacterium]|jgi:glycosyltransferase involved in cell wall biosynthesis/GT2 family glycosyltransferase|nr:glycosyltransferase [Bryobacteraceae bacterium]
MTVSIVINTYNRAGSLRETLHALRFLRDVTFEVVVVAGPCTDATDEVLTEFSGKIRTAVCPERNISRSRNIGIQMAGGDIVAFIDDDAIPDEYWLRDLVAGYDKADVGGAGGMVYDHTGVAFQYHYSAANRLGDAEWNEKGPLSDQVIFPGCPRFPYLQGTNASFRRKVLTAVGGFDETFDYYLDETELCLRVIDAGYRLKQLPNAFVYHRFLPSYIRNTARVPTNWRPIIKNKLYFALRHRRPHTSVAEILENALSFTDNARSSLQTHLGQNGIGPEQLDRFETDADEAFREGLRIGLSPAPRLLNPTARVAGHSTFLPHPKPALPDGPLTICFLAPEFAPFVADSDGRYAAELAAGLAEAGHSVHVVTTSFEGSASVDFERGVWVHRLVPHSIRDNPPATLAVYGEHWRRSVVFSREVQRIHRRHPIDILDAPLWGAGGIASILEDSLCTVTRVGSAALTMQRQPSRWIPPEPPKAQLQRLTGAERLVLRGSAAVRCDTVCRGNRLSAELGEDFIQPEVVLPGLEAMRPAGSSPKHDDRLVVLYAGNLDKNRGIDLLRDAVLSSGSALARVRFRVVGADNELVSPGMNRLGRWEGAPLDERIELTLALSDEELQSELAACDILVAPALTDPFTPLLLEAMGLGRAIIATRTGATDEFLRHEMDALLAEPNDVDSLRNCLCAMVESRSLRESLGKSAQERYQKMFTRQAYARRVESFYRSAMASAQGKKAKCAPV